MSNITESEIVTVRGIAAQIQAMHTPTFNALKNVLQQFGWKLTKEEKEPDHWNRQ